jgi:hypothetical protein
VVYGVILIIVMILLPGGAAGLIRRLQALYKSRLPSRSLSRTTD